VVTAVRRLARGDERPRIAGLDSLVRGHVELRVLGAADDLAAGAELRRQEEREVRLVPDSPARDRAETDPLAVVARCEHVRELRQVDQVLWWVVVRLAAVRPARPAGDRDEDR